MTSEMMNFAEEDQDDGQAMKENRGQMNGKDEIGVLATQAFLPFGFKHTTSTIETPGLSTRSFHTRKFMQGLEMSTGRDSPF